VNTAGTRFEQRKNATHALLLRQAESLIAARGADTITLDAVAERANVSRATLFNHFSSREALLTEVLSPVFDDCIALLEQLASCAEGVTVESVQNACIYMWEKHRGTICRPFSEKSIGGIPELSEKHERMSELFMGLFSALGSTASFRLKRAEDTALLVFRVFIPLLDATAHLSPDYSAFRSCLSGLILDSPEETPARSKGSK